MKNSTKIILGAVVILAIVVGAYVTTHRNVSVQGVSPVGANNSSAKLYTSVLSLTSKSATSTSILNNSGYDWMEISEVAACTSVGTSYTVNTGAALAALTITSATTSVSTPSSVSNTNYINVMTIGTSTVNSFASSTSESALPGTGRIIPNGTYATFWSNATNTAQCTVGAYIVNL